MSVDPREFRRTIGLFATGVTVITAEAGDQPHGMTANAITSVSLDPLLVLFCVDRRTHMAEIIGMTKRFAINILGADQEPISRYFANQSGGAFDGVFGQLHGVPVLPGAIATVACTIDRVLDGGDHLIVLGRVDALARDGDDEPPLLYFGGGYRQILVES